jgi:hypothetical protein
MGGEKVVQWEARQMTSSRKTPLKGINVAGVSEIAGANGASGNCLTEDEKE